MRRDLSLVDIIRRGDRLELQPVAGRKQSALQRRDPGVRVAALEAGDGCLSRAQARASSAWVRPARVRAALRSDPVLATS